MKRKPIILLIFISISFSLAVAQSSSFSHIGILEKYGHIFENNQIKGYYMFYRVDKIAKKTYSYRLRILDQNMREAVSTTIEGPEFFRMIEATFNGNAFAFLFFDSRARTFQLITCDKQAKEIASKTYPKIGKIEYSWNVGLGMFNDDTSNPSIYPVGDEGFVRLRLRKKGLKLGYELEYFPNDLSEQEGWTVGSPEKLEIFEYATVSYVDENFATIIIVHRDGMMFRDFKYSVQLIDMKTGEIAFKAAMSRSDYNYSVLYATFDRKENQVLLMGNYYAADDKALKSKSKGLYAMSMNIDGSERNKNMISWDKDISQFLDVDGEGRLDEGGFITIHKIVRSSDGKIYAIGEEFSRTSSDPEILKNLLGVKYRNVFLKDMVIFELGEDLSLKNVKVFEKEEREKTLQQAYKVMSSGILAYYMKILGWFDFAYTQQSENKDVFYATYFSTIKTEKKEQKKIFGVIIRDEKGEFSTDQIILETEATKMGIMPAKAGYIAIWEHFTKENKIDFRLEQVNY